LLERLEAGSWSCRYVVKYFLRSLPTVITNPGQRSRCIEAISGAVLNDDQEVRRELVEYIVYLPEDWQRAFGDRLKGVTDETLPATYLFDGTPFLSASSAEEEIPF